MATEYDLGSVIGPQGATGPQGISVTNVSINAQGNLIVTLSNGSNVNAGNAKGAKGDKGEIGKSAYQQAKEGGYAKTEAQFIAELNSIASKANAADVYTKGEVDVLNALIGQSVPLSDVTDTAVTHRNSFRGKNLGTVVTATQKAAIRNGSFEDLWLGDYWIIGGRNWRIADINYWLNCGDTAAPPNHLVIMPDIVLYNYQMNETNSTVGGYVGSKMYTEGLAQAKAMIASAFPGIVLSHREPLINAVTDGYPSGGAWYDSTVELPNEIMMYGSYIFTPACDGVIVPFRYTASNSQLALMAVCPRFIKIRETYWLRDVVSAVAFALTDYSGHSSYYLAASNAFGVRPVFAIG